MYKSDYCIIDIKTKQLMGKIIQYHSMYKSGYERRHIQLYCQSWP